MNYTYKFLFAALFLNFGCKGMYLDFTKISKEIGQEKGAREAKWLLTLSKASPDLLRPLFNELDTTLRFVTIHPESKSQFSGFVLGYALILFRYNNLNPTAPIQLDPTVFGNLVKKRCETQVDAVVQKHRGELVKLLAGTLTDKNLLQLPPAHNE